MDANKTKSSQDPAFTATQIKDLTQEVKLTPASQIRLDQ